MNFEELPFENVESVSNTELIFKPCSICTFYEPDSVLFTFGNVRQTSDGFTTVYTDGSCLGNGRRNPRAGIGIFFGPESILNVSRKLPERYTQTNNNAEIVAVLTAFQICRKLSFFKVEIRTDSKFLLTCLTTYLPLWQSNGWLRTNKKPVKNKEELLELGRELRDFTVRWVHVPAHSNDRRSIGNDYADFLAQIALL